MVGKSKQSDLMKRYKAALDVFDKNLKYLGGVGVDPDVLHDCRQMLNHMRSKSLVEVVHVLVTEGGEGRSIQAENSDDIGRMTLDDIKERINSSKTTRATMEKIASVRFGVSKGGLSSLRSRDALKDKIESLLGNEKAHDLISQVVQAGEGISKKSRN